LLLPGCTWPGNISTAKDSWLDPVTNLGAIGALYNLTMDPYEKYDMIFNGAAPMRVMTSSPGRYAGEDRLGLGADLTGHRGLRQVDHQISEHQAVPGRRVDRSYAGPAASQSPFPLLKHQQQQPQPIGGG
jgi:arylsulfatase